MSALETHDDHLANTLRYAPRRASPPQQDDGTIKPILERLSRGESDSYSVPRNTASVHIDARPAKRVPWGLIAGGAASAALSAGAAIVAIGWFGSGASEIKRPAAAELAPKTVHTVSFKQAAAPKETTAIAPAAEPAPVEAAPAANLAAAPANEVAAAPVQTPAEPAANPLLSAAPKAGPQELLARWSGVPADIAVQQPATTPAPPVENEPAQAAAKNDDGASRPAASSRHHAAKHVRHHRVHTRRHAQAAAQTVHVQASAAEPQVQAQPEGTALQSLLHASASAQAQAASPAARRPD